MSQSFPAARRLRNALEKRDPDEVELALNDWPDVSDVEASALATLVDTLEADWHKRHEDTVLTLQHCGDDSVVDALFQATTVSHDYLSYDERFGLARKCTWALADIGSDRARRALEALSGSSNQLIAEYAQKRLDRWQSERSRKRYAGPA